MALADVRLSSVVSLPLMGIDNTRRRPAEARSRRSHYPSWGSITRCVHVAESGSARTHLPLMGIDNRPSLAGNSHHLASHYPSWGSITITRSRQSSVSQSSLPLMGIDNLVVLRLKAPSSRSLPLMGIDNPPLACVPTLFRLITPHGDR